MDTLVSMADAFIGVFRTSADVFVSLTTGIIPLIVVFLTAVNALVKFIGEDKVENFAKWAAQEGWMYVPVRYTLLPFVAVFMLTNPVCYTFGTFLPEKNKPQNIQQFTQDAEKQNNNLYFWRTVFILCIFALVLLGVYMKKVKK